MFGLCIFLVRAQGMSFGVLCLQLCHFGCLPGAALWTACWCHRCAYRSLYKSMLPPFAFCSPGVCPSLRSPFCILRVAPCTMKGKMCPRRGRCAHAEDVPEACRPPSSKMKMRHIKKCYLQGAVPIKANGAQLGIISLLAMPEAVANGNGNFA